MPAFSCPFAENGKGRPGDHILAYRRRHEPLGRDDRHLAGFHVGDCDHSADAAKVVHMRVSVHHRDDGTGTQLPIHQFPRCPRCLDRSQRIDDNPAGVSLHESRVGQVEAPYLPDMIVHLEESVERHQLGVAPETGVHGRRRRPLEKVQGREIPNNPAIAAYDLRVGAGADVPLASEVFIAGIQHWSRRQSGSLCCARSNRDR
jgi:hypothetical protein